MATKKKSIKGSKAKKKVEELTKDEPVKFSRSAKDIRKSLYGKAK